MISNRAGNPTYKIGRFNIDHGSFNGDVNQAISFIKYFLATNKVTTESRGHGYGNLVVDDRNGNVTKYDFSPGGISLPTMISYAETATNMKLADYDINTPIPEQQYDDSVSSSCPCPIL